MRTVTFCGIMNPGSGGTIARGALPGCNGLEDQSPCARTRPALPCGAATVQGNRDPRPQVRRRSILDPGFLSLFVFRGNYDGEVSSIEAGQTDPGINADFDYAASSTTATAGSPRTGRTASGWTATTPRPGSSGWDFRRTISPALLFPGSDTSASVFPTCSSSRKGRMECSRRPGRPT